MLKITHLEGQAEILGFIHKSFFISNDKATVACGVEVTKIGSNEPKFRVYDYEKDMEAAIKQLFHGKAVSFSRPI